MSELQTRTVAPPPDPTPDAKAGDQKTTYTSAKWVQAQLKKFGIFTDLFYNPTSPGADYILITPQNESYVLTGEHIFLNEVNNSYCNTDLLLKNLENSNLNAYNKIARCLLDFNFAQATPNDLYVVQDLTNDGMQVLLDQPIP